MQKIIQLARRDIQHFIVSVFMLSTHLLIYKKRGLIISWIIKENYVYASAAKYIISDTAQMYN